MVRVDLERKIETLREELEYNRKVHNEEMEDLKEQISSQESIIKIIISLPPKYFQPKILDFFKNRSYFTKCIKWWQKVGIFPDAFAFWNGASAESWVQLNVDAFQLLFCFVVTSLILNLRDL